MTHVCMVFTHTPHLPVIEWHFGSLPPLSMLTPVTPPCPMLTPGHSRLSPTLLRSLPPHISLTPVTPASSHAHSCLTPASGVHKIIITAGSLSESRAALELAKKDGMCLPFTLCHHVRLPWPSMQSLSAGTCSSTILHCWCSSDPVWGV